MTTTKKRTVYVVLVLLSAALTCLPTIWAWLGPASLYGIYDNPVGNFAVNVLSPILGFAALIAYVLFVFTFVGRPVTLGRFLRAWLTWAFVWFVFWGIIIFISSFGGHSEAGALPLALFIDLISSFLPVLVYPFYSLFIRLRS